MNPIDDIRIKLRNYPNVKFESTDSSITVLPTSDIGFRVGIEGAPGRYTVFFNGGTRNSQAPTKHWIVSLSGYLTNVA